MALILAAVTTSPVFAATPPSAPTITTFGWCDTACQTSGTCGVCFTWSRPVSDGGANISLYRVNVYYNGVFNRYINVTATTGATQSSTTIPSPGVQYYSPSTYVTVQAQNTAGLSPASNMMGIGPPPPTATPTVPPTVTRTPTPPLPTFTPTVVPPTKTPTRTPTPPPTATVVPSLKLSVTNRTYYAATLSIAASGISATGYNVQYTTDATFASGLITRNESVTTPTVTFPKPAEYDIANSSTPLGIGGGTVYFRVVSFSTPQYTSNIVASPSPCTKPLQVPTNITVKPASGTTCAGGVIVSWTLPSSAIPPATAAQCPVASSFESYINGSYKAPANNTGCSGTTCSFTQPASAMQLDGKMLTLSSGGTYKFTVGVAWPTISQLTTMGTYKYFYGTAPGSITCP